MQATKKTVGILTLHKPIYSYGAAMQAYATYLTLKELGYLPQIIDLCLESRFTLRLSQRFPIPTQAIRRHVINGLIVEYLKHPFRLYKFRQFNKMIEYSKTYHKTDCLYANPPKYDLYLVGSDQVWNPCISYNIEPFLLTFLSGNEKKISYASSIGRTDLPQEYKAMFHRSLSTFSHISVREEQTRRIIQSILPTADISVVLDPTLLVDAKHWISISKKSKYNNYLLCYCLTNEHKKLKFAEKIAKHNGLQLIVIGDNVSGVEAKFLNQVGPKEWIGLIQGAKHIITDSFHGTIFSIMLNNNFMVLCNEINRETRINHLLKITGLTSHITDDYRIGYFISNTVINKANVLDKIEAEKKKSISFLINALES